MPEVDYDIDFVQVWMMRLSKAGYGDIQTIKNIDGSTFFNLIHYENFISDYETSIKALNSKR